MSWYILDGVTTLRDVNLCSKVYSFQASRYLWNANTACHSWLGTEITYSLYYLLWRSLHSSVCVMISFTMTIHPCVFHMYENSISKRYSQCWWAAEVVSDHYSACIESIYLNRMKMWCEGGLIYAILPDKPPAWQDCSTQGSHRKDVSFQRGDLGNLFLFLIDKTFFSFPALY